MSLDERIDDLDRLRTWRGGDVQAGDRLLARHFGAVYRFFRSKAEPTAEALVQATFVAVRDAEPDAAAPSFKALLFAAARERLLEHLGRVGGRRIDATSTTLARLVPTPDPSVEDVHLALRGLPLDVQLAVELHHWERLSVADVAYVIGLGAGAVKGRLARVRKQLDAKVLRGPKLLLDADSQRAWAQVRARVFDESGRGGFARYRIVEPLEQGALGRTFVAHDEELGRDVALTLVAVDQVASAERIVRAARARVGIVDRHRIEVLDAGLTQDPRAFVLVGPWPASSASAAPARVVFVATELVRGATLRRWAEADERSVADVLDVFVQAGQGLAALHEHGLVHGGFEADDVIVADDGCVRLADAGLAAVDQLADPRSDQPAFCLALRDALAGTLSHAEATRHRTASSYLMPLPGMPTALHRAIVKGLSVDPGSRWPHMSALLDAISHSTGPAVPAQAAAPRTTVLSSRPSAVAE
jgi:RNA polymerase sigma-70 factor (ECF subfamily)